MITKENLVDCVRHARVIGFLLRRMRGDVEVSGNLCSETRSVRYTNCQETASNIQTRTVLCSWFDTANIIILSRTGTERKRREAETVGSRDGTNTLLRLLLGKTTLHAVAQPATRHQRGWVLANINEQGPAKHK